MWQPWAMFAVGVLCGTVVQLIIRECREERWRTEMIALLNVAIQDTELDRSRAMQLAIGRAWDVVKQRRPYMHVC